MNTTTATPYAVTPPSARTPKQPQQRQTAKDIIAANVKSLIEQLEAGHSDALHRLPRRDEPVPQLQLWKHSGDCAAKRPTATRVAGLYAWNQLGRKVKKGEKGIRILAPIVGHQAQERTRKPTRTSPSKIRASWLAFRNAYVFRRGADRRRRASHLTRDDRNGRREPRQSGFLHRSPGHRACPSRRRSPQLWA